MTNLVSLRSRMQATEVPSTLTIHSSGLKGFVRLSEDGKYVIFSAASTGTVLSVPITTPLSLVLLDLHEMFRDVKTVEEVEG